MHIALAETVTSFTTYFKGKRGCNEFYVLNLLLIISEGRCILHWYLIEKKKDIRNNLLPANVERWQAVGGR